MADIKISALPAAAALTGTELVPVVQSGSTVQSTASAMLNQPNQGVTASVANLANGLIAGVGAGNSGQVFLFNNASTVLILNNNGDKSVQYNSQDDTNTTYVTLAVRGTGGAGAGQFTITGSLKSSLGFGANGATPQAKAAVNAASVDLATVIALCNQLRAALVNNGICV